MAKFYLMGNYTSKAFQGFIANPDTDRGAAIKAVASAVGGKVLSYDLLEVLMILLFQLMHLTLKVWQQQNLLPKHLEQLLT